MRKRIDVEIISDKWAPSDAAYREKGVLFDSGKVISIDDIGGLSVYELVYMKSDNLAVVEEDAAIDYDRELLINLILGGK
ncbi:hypothetical protein H9655_21150 [Cytobacillus sp. Sa5YUA1]|uniref:Uncharacterized protein n=1 Tax=Cytobacillus stercorigallinarum TaxID=2762240 RepID=A0ABR8QVT7_9BACI|nr:hypothetical protein [Cytobacillus stercorigallinarum]MBD7939554.1 hypothetical protein [Cytobacillus stercorigallinarum]